MYKQLTRRNILASLGGAAAVQAFAPFIPRLEAAEGDSSIKRYAYWVEYTMPKTEIVNANYQGADGNLKFKNDYSPLNEIANKIIFLRQMERPQGKKVGGGVHADGAHGITGWRTIDGGVFNPKATTIDQYLAQQLSNQTVFSHIPAGFKNTGRANDIDISCSVVKGKPIPRYKQPIDLYNAVFKDIVGNSASDPNASSLLRQRKSVLDFAVERTNAISKKVSHFDRDSIESHLTSIRETEKRLEATLGGSASCDNVDAPNGKVSENESQIWPAYSELVAAALRCDLTRVTGMCYGGATSNLTYAFLPSWSGKGNYHPATHGKNNGEDYIHDVLRFRAQQVTYFLKLLDSVQEADGNTLLDNTIFGWFTEVARNHNTTSDIHCVLAGGKGRFKNQGKMVSVKKSDKYNQLLASIAHFMGFPVDGYGDPEYGGKGVLSSDLFV